MTRPASVTDICFDINSKFTPGHARYIDAARRDLVAALGMWRLCWSLAVLDIKLRYRGSILGPFWLSLSSALMIGMMGGLYAGLFHTDLHGYLPFLALSIVLWNFMQALVSDACGCYIDAETTIRAVRLPLLLHPARVLLRNLLILGHNVVVVLLVDTLLNTWPGWTALLAIPAMLWWLMVGLATCVLLGTVCARFRDIPPIVGSLMQLAFFVSGVIWQPQQLQSHAWILVFNPVFSLLEVVRAPLLGEVPAAGNVAAALVYGGATIGLAAVLFIRTRGRIAFWI